MLNFAEAMTLVHEGKFVARHAWENKPDNWCALFVVPSSHITVQEGRPLAKMLPLGTEVIYEGHIDMLRTHLGKKYVTQWIPNPLDSVAKDWYIADPSFGR